MHLGYDSTLALSRRDVPQRVSKRPARFRTSIPAQCRPTRSASSAASACHKASCWESASERLFMPARAGRISARQSQQRAAAHRGRSGRLAKHEAFHQRHPVVSARRDESESKRFSASARSSTIATATSRRSSSRNFLAKPQHCGWPTPAGTDARRSSLDDRGGQGWCSGLAMNISGAAQSAWPYHVATTRWRRHQRIGGGVSLLTPDHVNPEAPWPHSRCAGARETGAAGKILVERLALYPDYMRSDLERWVDAALYKAVLDHIDADGLARTDQWSPGASAEIPPGGGRVVRRCPAIGACWMARSAGSSTRRAPAKPCPAIDATRLFRARLRRNSQPCAVPPTRCAQRSTASG